MIKLKESEFFRNVLILFSGSFLSQLLPFILLPILQKYFYTPADFGLLAVFVSFCELFSQIATFKLEFGIVIQHKIRAAINLAFGAFRISIGVAITSLIIVLLFKSNIANYFNEPKIENYLFLLPIYILTSSFNDISSYWFNRKKKFGVIATSKIVQTSSSESVKFLGGLSGMSFIGLVLGRISGFLVANFFYIYKFIKEDKKTLKLLNRKDSNQEIRNNKNLIFYSTPSVFIGTLINLVYLNLFLYYFGKEIVGLIGVSMTYLSAGFGIVAVSFSQVFYSKVSETKTIAQLLSIYKRFVKNLALLALLPLLFVYLIPTSGVVYLLGDSWAELMPIARIMVLWLSVWFVSSSLSFIYIRLGKQRAMMIYDFLHLILIIFGFSIAYYLKSTVESALWGFTFAQIIFYLFVIYIAIHFIKTTDESKL